MTRRSIIQALGRASTSNSASTGTSTMMRLAVPARRNTTASASGRMASDAELGRHFYLNKVLEQWAAKPAIRMTLRQLIFFGKTLGMDREKILKSANYVRQELPVRIAHRIRDLQALPFVVMTNKHLEDVYNKYWAAFETLRRFPHIRSIDDNERFVALLKRLLEDHLTIIPSLTIGIVESSEHLPPQQLDKFMERMLRSRISRRVLAEQHIALSEALDDPFHFFNEPIQRNDDTDELDENVVGDHVGIIYTHLSVSSVVNKGIRLLTKTFGTVEGIPAERMPRMIVDGDLKARFAYIPEHLEYIVFELLKNAIRATIRRHVDREDTGVVRVTIVEGPPEEDLIIRISDSGGGLPDLISQLSTPGAEGLPTPPPPTSSPAIDPFSDPQPTPSWYARGGVGSAGTTSASDPLIDALCSFSTVRRRLDLEAQRDARSEAGLATRDRFDALRSVRRFKGTVTEGTGPAALDTVQVETGLGLPMARVYCDFFGGSLSLRSLDGVATDVYVRLPKLGTNKESIEEIVL